MPWVATAGNGRKRNIESGVNGAEIAAVLQQKMQECTYLLFILFGLAERWHVHLYVACIKQAFFWFSIGFD